MVRRATRLLAVVAVLAACGQTDRPADADWAETWAEERALVPDVSAFQDGGQAMCDRLVGELRSARERLEPTPTDGLDGAVDAWIAHAESIAFDCPHDPEEIEQRLDDLHVLAAEVDAGLAADQG